jgi:hypothetical protein
MPISEWNTLRTFNGSQREAFEELCCQLAHCEIPEDYKFIRKGTPDAGVECFTIAPDNTEWGWQAKFIFELGNAQWQELEASFYTAIEKHPKLVRYYFCLPIDLSDARVRKQNSQLQKWQEHKEKWENKARENGLVIEICYWGKFEIFERLSMDINKGRTLFWFTQKIFDTNWFQEKLKLVLDAAGPRYTPELNVELPIVSAFNALGRNPEFCNSIRLYSGEIKKAFTEISLKNKSLYSDEESEKFNRFNSLIDDYLNQIAISTVQRYPLEILHKQIQEFLELLDTSYEKMVDLDIKEKGKDLLKSQNLKNAPRYQSKFISSINSISKLTRKIQELEDFLTSEEMKLANNSFMVLTGDAGTGKTHLFCDVSSNRISQGIPTVMVLGEWFPSGEEPWTQLMQLLDFRNSTIEEFLGALSSAAEASGHKALILIDAINESGDRKIWLNHLTRIITIISNFPWIGLAISVRSSYEKITIPNQLVDDGRLIRIQHQGFSNHEYDAVKNFFDFYKLELPSFPLLLPEFSNPLFLKTLCKGLHDKGDSRFPAGSAGLTSIFQLFIDSIDNRVWKEYFSEHYLKPRSHVWKAIENLAEEMMRTGQIWLKFEDAEIIVNRLTDKLDVPLLKILISEGVVSTAVQYRKDSNFEVIRFSYEKFSDHILVKHLIDKYFHSKLDSEVFSSNGKLNFIINEPWQNQGLIEALCIQIPERFGLEFPALFSKELDESIIAHPFLSSIIWRDTAFFTDETNRLFFKYFVKDLRFALDSLLTVSTNPLHPYNAKFLDKVLTQHSMAERDSWWTIYLHHSIGRQNAVERILDWSEGNQNKEKISDESLELCGITLTWFLTSSNRLVRDRATKALVVLFTQKLNILENILNLFDKVDDYFVVERLYGVAYGCTLRSIDVKLKKSLAEKVFQLIFSENPPVHILIRDYARGVIETCISQGINLDIPVEKISPPYHSTFPVIPGKEDINVYNIDSPSYDSYDSKWSQGRIWHSIMSDDFARYIIGTNFSKESNHWLSIKIGDSSGKSPAILFDEFVSSLSVEQMNAWNNFQEIRLIENRIGVSTLKSLSTDSLRVIVSLKPEDKKTDQSDEVATAYKLVFDEANKKTQEAACIFAKTLEDEKQKEFYEFILPYQEHPSTFNELPGYKLDQLQRWILKRVFDLGWTVERFGRFDRFDIGFSSREDHRAERIGKKYQWIAYHEFLAYLSDNYQFHERYGDRKDTYEGPWQLGIRDIDPSCTIKSTKDENDPKSCWWKPLSYESWKLDESEESWLHNLSDIPHLPSFLEATFPIDNSKWLNLDGLYIWKQPVPIGEDKDKIPKRELWFMIKSYLTNSKDLLTLSDWAGKQNFMGRWMPEPVSLYDVFIGEFFWSKAYFYATEDNCSKWFGKEDGLKTPVKILPTIQEYLSEAKGYDFSVDNSFKIKVPTFEISRLMGQKWTGIEGQYFNKNGELTFQDPSIFDSGPSVLLVHKEKFIDFLDQNQLSLLWTVIGEKRSIGGRMDYDDKKGYLNITGAYWLIDGVIKGKITSSYKDYQH